MLNRVTHNMLFFCMAMAALLPNISNASGEEIYQAHCAMCHETGVSNAPKRGDHKAWAGRGNMETLLSAAEKGLGAMPAHGNCGSCTPKELEEAIEYMKK